MGKKRVLVSYGVDIDVRSVASDDRNVVDHGWRRLLLAGLVHMAAKIQRAI